ncbi:hypothetical protein C8F04DRAFT_1198733 [Mycena alexandri]|uniref:Uncharacterized protein n=1 Tax=Mycena alexandri TaxID=1745969 RepID=A0AAD6S0M6_9AGAR|nr:hypothetical protein C8F04DRAFT_1198733 [Mycena alexandri]
MFQSSFLAPNVFVHKEVQSYGIQNKKTHYEKQATEEVPKTAAKKAVGQREGQVTGGQRSGAGRRRRASARSGPGSPQAHRIVASEGEDMEGLGALHRMARGGRGIGREGSAGPAARRAGNDERGKCPPAQFLVFAAAPECPRKRFKTPVMANGCYATHSKGWYTNPPL